MISAPPSGKMTRDMACSRAPLRVFGSCVAVLLTHWFTKQPCRQSEEAKTGPRQSDGEDAITTDRGVSSLRYAPPANPPESGRRRTPEIMLRRTPHHASAAGPGRSPGLTTANLNVTCGGGASPAGGRPTLSVTSRAGVGGPLGCGGLTEAEARRPGEGRVGGTRLPRP